jgi:hypothetical protein
MAELCLLERRVVERPSRPPGSGRATSNAGSSTQCAPATNLLLMTPFFLSENAPVIESNGHATCHLRRMLAQSQIDIPRPSHRSSPRASHPHQNPFKRQRSFWILLFICQPPSTIRPLLPARGASSMPRTSPSPCLTRKKHMINPFTFISHSPCVCNTLQPSQDSQHTPTISICKRCLVFGEIGSVGSKKGRRVPSSL